LDIYRFCLYAGVTGIACMAVLGMGHFSFGHGTHGAAHGSGHGGHAGGHGAHGAARGAPGARGHAAHNSSARGSAGGTMLDILLGFLSPRVLFSLSLGFGLSGVLLKRAMAEPALLILALCGGLLFEGLFVRPLWNLAFRFASNPARTLESAVFEEGRAVTDFDANGNGLVAIDLDGQVMQVLGVLKPQDREMSTRVRTGERLFIEEIDTARNRCTVSRLSS